MSAPFETALRKYATPATLWLSLIIGVSGALMFFHLAPGPLKSAHEWLGLVFAVAAVAHGWRHRQSVVNLFGQRRTYALAALSLLAGGLFFALPPQPSPVGAVMRQMENAPLTNIAALLGQSPDDLAQSLRGRGVVVAGVDQTPAQLARNNEMDPRRMIGMVMSPPANRPAPPASGEPAK